MRLAAVARSLPRSRAIAAVRPLVASEAFGQLLRFAVAGAGVTALSIAAYLVAAIPLGIHAMIANLVSHVVGVVAGFAVHSRWSFRAEPSDARAMALRFTIASGAAFALNSAWVWLAVTMLHGPAWLPVPAMVFVTPLGSFAMNRYWVFARD